MQISKSNPLDRNNTYAVSTANVAGLVQQDEITKLASGDIRDAPDAPIAPIADGRFAIRLRFVDYVQIAVTKEELNRIITDAKTILDSQRG